MTDATIGLRERVVALETNMGHIATKAWVLGVVFGGAILNAGLTVGLLKLVGGTS